MFTFHWQKFIFRMDFADVHTLTTIPVTKHGRKGSLGMDQTLSMLSAWLQDPWRGGQTSGVGTFPFRGNRHFSSESPPPSLCTGTQSHALNSPQSKQHHLRCAGHHKHFLRHPVLIKAHVSDCWRPLHGPCSTKCPRARSDTTRSIFRLHASWRSADDLNLLSFAFQCFVFHLESWCLWRVGMCGRCRFLFVGIFFRFLLIFHFWRFPSPCTQ